MAFAKLAHAVRRNELLVLASLLAGLVMALFMMTVTWLTGTGLWAFPGYVAATAFRSLQAGGTLSFSWPQIAAGFGLHLAVTLAMGVLFARLSPKLREVAGLGGISETPAYGLVGLCFGLAVFAGAWWGVLPYANPIMVYGLDPTFFAIGHAVWGACLGVTRKAWTQTASYPTRRTSASPDPTPAASSHKAPSGSTSSAGTLVEEPTEDVATLEPEADETEETDEEEDEPFPASASTPQDDGDDLSPWPDPPSEDDYADEDDYTPSTPSPSTSPSSDEDEEEPVYVTEHARRSLKGLTGSEPELPPVHRELEACLTHVAPGRAVCTLEGRERLHDATGAVQAGMLTSLAELAATVAMRTVAPDSEHVIVTSTIEVDGALTEGHIVAEAEVTEQAGTTTLATVEVRDASGQTLVDARFQAASGD